jgi:hypothetical protein
MKAKNKELGGIVGVSVFNAGLVITASQADHLTGHCAQPLPTPSCGTLKIKPLGKPKAYRMM